MNNHYSLLLFLHFFVNELLYLYIINYNYFHFYLLFIDTTIHLQKNVKEEVDYNDYSYIELLYKLYLGLNLLNRR